MPIAIRRVSPLSNDKAIFGNRRDRGQRGLVRHGVTPVTTATMRGRAQMPPPRGLSQVSSSKLSFTVARLHNMARGGQRTASRQPIGWRRRAHGLLYLAKYQIYYYISNRYAAILGSAFSMLQPQNSTPIWASNLAHSYVKSAEIVQSCPPFLCLGTGSLGWCNSQTAVALPLSVLPPAAWSSPKLLQQGRATAY